MNNKPIGLLGGTFDPIHLGHLHIATILYQQLDLQELRFIPSHQPLLRQPPIASVLQRLQMVELAIQDFANFSVDAREIQRPGPSFTYDTLLSIRKEITNIPLVFIMGIDQFTNLNHWHRWQELISLAHLAVVTRPGYEFSPNPAIFNLLSKHQINDYHLLHQKSSGYILLQSIPPSPISASQVRDLLKQYKSVDTLLPANVLKFIENNHLYSNFR